MNAQAALPKHLNNEQTQEAKEAFSLFDIDDSGFIDPKELCTSIRLYGMKDLRNEILLILNELDKLNEPIDFNQFMKIVNSVLEKRDPAQEIEKAFNRFDDDSTGRISFRNLKRAAIELGEQLTDDEISEILGSFKTEKKGEISKDEFTSIMETSSIM